MISVTLEFGLRRRREAVPRSPRGTGRSLEPDVRGVRAHPAFCAESLWSPQGEGSREVRVSRSIFRMAIDIIFESTNSVGHNHLQSRTPLSKWLPTSRISRVSSSSCPSNPPARADMPISNYLPAIPLNFRLSAITQSVWTSKTCISENPGSPP